MTKRKERDLSDKGGVAGFNMGDLGPDGDTNLHGTENVSAPIGEGHPEGTTIDDERSDEPIYAKVEDVKLGDTLVVTGDEYDCVHDGDEKEVKQDWNGRLFVDCDEGKHHLDKGTDIHDYIIGFLLKPAKAV